MSEDQAPYEAKERNIGPTSVSKREIEEAETAVAVQVEIEKIHSLPDGYWPAEWRKHVRALSITSLALIYWMAHNSKAHEVDLCATQVLDEVGKVFLEMEHSMSD